MNGLTEVLAARKKAAKKGGARAAAGKKTTAMAAAVKKAMKAKLKGMTKEEKEKYRKGKRDTGSDSEYSYRSVVSAGGTRHVKRRRKRDDGTYSDEHSYHSSQDEEGEARRRRRRRDREHGSDSEHSYYSVVSAGGTRTVRRKKRNADGTYSRSESFRSGANLSDEEAYALLKDEMEKSAGQNKERRRGSDGSGDSEDEEESDVSIVSEVSEGGTRRQVQRKRIRDADGNIVGYGDPKPVKGRSSRGFKGSERDAKEAVDSLKIKRNGELLRETTTDSLKNLRNEGESLIPGDVKWPGSEAALNEQKLLDEEMKVPSDFSDATTEDDIDLSKLNPAQRRQYLAMKEQKRKEREKRRREKYGDKYDEIMKKKNEKKYASLAEKEAEMAAKREEDKERLKVQEDRRMSSLRRRSSAASTLSKGGGRPKSMVTYDKGAPRPLANTSKKDNREIGLSHDDWASKRDTDLNKRNRRGSDASEGSDLPPKLHRETTMIKPLPTIPQGRIYESEDDKSINTGRTSKSIKFLTDDDTESALSEKLKKEQEEDKQTFEVGADGKLKLKKKKIDLDNITADELRALGIDPNLSAKEIAKRLKSIFGKDIEITQGGVTVGTKGIGEYDSDISDSALADDPDLDLDTLSGLKRVNVIMRRGGAVLQKHLERVISLSKLVDKYAKDLDERDADIDFLSHYKLVDPSRVDGYARAFVVEDSDLDTVLNSHEARVALDGVPSIQHMTSKQMDYVMKVLKIDEATLITFRMFGVMTALCERVTHMDSMSQRLLEICNLADIERKLDLYKAMFYTNIPSDRDPNFITSDSLKIELIAGGLNWKQQQHIIEKMVPNDFGEISFLDYMCYIPLFLSMHDNICYNPLDMSNDKYQQPPRQRPASVQRDMNPLGANLTKQSAYWVRKKAMDMMQGTNNNSVQVSRRYMDILNKYTSDKYTRLKRVEDQRRQSMLSKEKTASSFTSGSNDMIY